MRSQLVVEPLICAFVQYPIALHLICQNLLTCKALVEIYTTSVSTSLQVLLNSALVSRG